MFQFLHNLWQKISNFFNQINAWFAELLSTKEIQTPAVEPKEPENLDFPVVVTTTNPQAPSDHLKNERQSCDEIRFNEMINHIRELLGNLIMGIESAYVVGFPYLKRTLAYNADFKLDICSQRSALFSALRKVFGQMYVHHASKYWLILYFDSKKAQDHDLWSEEGRLQAFHNIFDLLVKETLVMSGRLGQNIEFFCKCYPNFSPEQVKNLLAMHFSQSRQRFMQTTDMDEKRAILLEIAESYEPIRKNIKLLSKIILNQDSRIKLLMLQLNKDFQYPIESRKIEDFLIGEGPKK